jgi:hypothetical protein
MNDFIKSLNIKGLTEEMKGQFAFVEAYCKDLDLSKEDRIEIEKNVAIFQKNLSELNKK